MSANTGRTGTGARRAPQDDRGGGQQPRTTGRPATGPAKPGRKAAVGLAGFGSAAALVGAGIAALASPTSAQHAVTQPGLGDVQTATLTDSLGTQFGGGPATGGSTGAPANLSPAPASVATPSPLVTGPSPQKDNFGVGVQVNGSIPLPAGPFDPFGGLKLSVTPNIVFPTELFGKPDGGSLRPTVTSDGLANFFNSLSGSVEPVPALNLSGFLQGSRGVDGALPFVNSAPGLAVGLAQAQQQQQDAAVNALFGEGGQLTTLLNNLSSSGFGAPPPASVPFITIPGGVFNPASANGAATFDQRFAPVLPGAEIPTTLGFSPFFGGLPFGMPATNVSGQPVLPANSDAIAANMGPLSFAPADAQSPPANVSALPGPQQGSLDQTFTNFFGAPSSGSLSGPIGALPTSGVLTMPGPMPNTGANGANGTDLTGGPAAPVMADVPAAPAAPVVADVPPAPAAPVMADVPPAPAAPVMADVPPAPAAPVVADLPVDSGSDFG